MSEGPEVISQHFRKAARSCELSHTQYSTGSERELDIHAGATAEMGKEHGESTEGSFLRRR